jgi:hypothetical protein
MIRGWSSLRLLGLAAVLSQVMLFADVTGTVLGVVKDSSGAVVPGVKVTATNVETNLVTAAVTDGLGQYRILALPVGNYRVQATFTGFQPFVATGVVLEVNQQRRVDVVLHAGAAEQTVTVSASALQVETTSTQLGLVVEEKKILELPLNGRSYLDLMSLQPGVAPKSTRGGGAGTISVNGQRENNNGFLVNGGDVSGVGNFEAQIQPNLDSVQEFRLLTNSFDAEYGRFSGAITNAITKSGTNSIHGSAFEFMRNDKMDARGFFDGNTKGALKRNQFGYAVGGPAIKNKLFWFTDYQGTRLVNGGTASEIPVISQAERQGDVGVQNLTGIVNGANWAQVLSQRLGYAVYDREPYSAVFPNGIIPQSAWSPAAKGTMQFIPAPNRGTDIYASAAASTRTSDNMFGQRVDFLNRLTGNWSAYWHYDKTNLINPYAGGSFPGFSSEQRTKRQQAVVNNTKILGPTAVNEFRINYTRIPVQNVPGANNIPSLESMGFVTGVGTLGINNSGPAGFKGIPSIGLNNFSFGSPSPSIQAQNTYHISDGFFKMVGRHTLKFGVDFRYYQMNQRNAGSSVGSFLFTGGETGYDVADYLLGAPDTYTQSSTQFLDSRSKYGSAFAQDAFQVSPSLTINVGLRWEFAQPWYDTQDKIVAIVPGQQSVMYPTAPRGLVYPGDPGVARTLAPTRYNNFAPRLGIAYSPGTSGGFFGKLFGGPGKTSIRMGSGIFYTAVQDDTLYWILGTAPFGEYWGAAAPPLLEEPFRTRSTGASQGHPFPFTPPAPGSAEARNFDFSPYLPLVYTLGYATDNALPYGIDYNLTIQRELPGKMVASVGYVGTLGRKLIAIQEANPGNQALCMSLRGDGVMAGKPWCGPFSEDSTFTRPDGSLVHGTRGPLGPNFGTTFVEGNWANSDYNSLQASLQRRAGSSFFLFSYTFSKAMDNASFFSNRINFLDHGLSRSLSNFDVTHNFVASYSYMIPFDKMFSSLPKRVVRGWAVSGIARFATGLPVGIYESDDRALSGTGALDRPDFVGPLNLIKDPRGTRRWFDNTGFTLEPLGRFGTANSRFFHGPGINNWDLSLHKDTAIRENMTLQLRAEFFNAFNHAQFGLPNGQFTAGSNSRMGIISNAAAPRIGQVAAKFIF